MNEEEKQAFKLLKNMTKNEPDVIRLSRDKGVYALIKMLRLIEKQQKEIEKLKEESIGDTKFDKLLFSIRMLHFHNYVNDKKFAEMIKKLSNENKGE